MTLPTTEEEITRKASETLVETMEGYATSLYSVDVAIERLNAIWGCCAGIADDEVMKMVADAINEMQEQRGSSFDVFRNEEKVALVQRVTKYSTHFSICMSGIWKQVSGDDLLKKREKLIREITKKYRHI